MSHNDLTALDLLRSSTELGFVPAQTVVGYLYHTGTIATADPGQAADWYSKAPS